MLRKYRWKQVLLFVLVIGVGGFAGPFLFIQEKPPGLSSEETIVADYAVLQVRQAIGGSSEPLIAFRIKATKITKKPGTSFIYVPTHDGIKYYRLNSAYEITVDAYTFFGIRYSQFIVDVDANKGSVHRI